MLQINKNQLKQFYKKCQKDKLIGIDTEFYRVDTYYPKLCLIQLANKSESICLDPITQDSCAFYERQAIYDHFSGVVEETEEGDRIANSLGDKQVIILKNHGILTTGSSVDIALWYFLSMEKCCQSQLMAEAAGKLTLIPHEVAIKTRGFIANDVALWASFQPLFDMIVSEQPDLLD